MVQVPLELFYCPSRRQVEAYPFVSKTDFVNIDRPPVVARCDYAANAGDQEPGLYGPGPASLAEGDSPAYAWPPMVQTGICFRRSEIRPGDIRDGTSSTYLVAEGYLDAHRYNTGDAANDDQGAYAGYDRDTLRVTHPSYPPLRDAPGVSSDHSFGSAHPAGFNAAFCDGSVRMISYGIDSETHRRLGNRHDRLPVDLSSL
jgi:prepilin-type processing-associated H-X9-DG protein